MYKSLNETGITIIGVTFGESYDDFYQKENPIPREYTLEPVDYRVDIYSRYSDEIYETFIKEGLEFIIFLIMEVIAMQKIINYYYMMINVIKLMEIHLLMGGINAIVIVSGIPQNVLDIIVILDIIMIMLKINVKKNVHMMKIKNLI